MAESISFNDMVYGQGEWKNLQEVIRKTFKACFSDLKQHDAELSSLTEQVHSLKDELNNRPTWEDLDKMIQLKLPSTVRNGANAENDLQQQLLQLRIEMEKKVSLSYFEMTLGKKMDRSDVLVRELSRFSLKEYQDDIKRLKLDQIHYQSQIDEIQEMVRKQQIQTNVCSTKFDDIALLQALLESVQKSVYERPTAQFVETTMKQMVNQTDLDILISKTAAKAETDMAIEKIEKTLNLHENVLTKLRLSQNDPTLFSDEYASASHLSSKPSKSTDIGDRGTAQDIIIPGMESSVIPVMWGKMNLLLKDNKKLRKQVQIVEEDLKTVRDTLTKAANVDKVELLGIIMEEQLQRIDSIIRGSIVIKPLQTEIQRIDEHLHTILEVLDLPQSETLSKRLHAINMTHQELKSKLLEVDAVVQQHIVGDLDSLHQQINSLESRWATYLHDRDRLGLIMENTNLTGTPYRDVKQLATHVEVMKKIIDASNGFETVNIPPHQCHSARINAMENLLMKSSNEIERVKYKMKQMKQVLITLSVDAPIIQVDKPSTTNHQENHHTRYQTTSNKAYETKEYHHKHKNNDTVESPISLLPTSEEQKQSTNHNNNNDSIVSTPSMLSSSSSQPSPPSMRLSSPDPVAPFHSSPESKNRIRTYRERLHNAPADFENILNEIFPSRAKENMNYQPQPGYKQSAEIPSSPGKSSISLTEVDIRLAELEKEKKRLRKLLVTNL